MNYRGFGLPLPVVIEWEEENEKEEDKWDRSSNGKDETDATTDKALVIDQSSQKYSYIRQFLPARDDFMVYHPTLLPKKAQLVPYLIAELDECDKEKCDHHKLSKFLAALFY